MVHARISIVVVVAESGRWDVTKTPVEDQLVLREMKEEVFLPSLHDVVDRWRSATSVPMRDRKVVPASMERLEILGEDWKVVAVGAYNPNSHRFSLKFLAPWREPKHRCTVVAKEWKVGCNCSPCCPHRGYRLYVQEGGVELWSTPPWVEDKYNQVRPGAFRGKQGVVDVARARELARQACAWYNDHAHDERRGVIDAEKIGQEICLVDPRGCLVSG